MRSLIVGTAGHIDHGKSALVKALTGTDPDRLKEEKERGITIDLGFAHSELGEGIQASFVDVPGHERFVRNMLAGAHGIDAVILVVAADESVMPQTREHFQICRLLGIPRGLVALTKCDMADPESQALAEMEVRDLVAGSFLERGPLVRVSARTGDGLVALKTALRGLAQQAVPRPADGLLRLPVDRVFTLKGFGTVVTGTVVSGAIGIGEELEVQPSGKRSRVRGLQTHGEAVARAVAGHRAAVNLAGLEVEDLARGDVLTLPGTLRPTSMVDAQLTLLPGERPLPDQARVRVHVASAEVLARVRVLGAPEVAAGRTASVQLRLERPALVGWHDRLIVRSYSPARTIGGAHVQDPLPPKRRSREATSGPADASLLQAAAAMIGESGAAGVDGATLAARLTVPLARLRAELEAAPGILSLGDPVVFVSREGLLGLGRTVMTRLESFHRAHPLKSAMPKEELRRQVFARAGEAVAEHVLHSLAATGEVSLLADAVALARHIVRLTPAEEEARGALLEATRAAGFGGVETGELAGRLAKDARLLERVSRTLLESRDLERVGGSRLVHREHLLSLKAEIRRRWPPGSRLDVGGVKDLTGLSRKFVIPLLEYLDREKVTRRAGAERVVL